MHSKVLVPTWEYDHSNTYSYHMYTQHWCGGSHPGLLHQDNCTVRLFPCLPGDAGTTSCVGLGTNELHNLTLLVVMHMNFTLSRIPMYPGQYISKWSSRQVTKLTKTIRSRLSTCY